MTKTHAQQKAKKEWLLHKPSAKKARCRRRQPREKYKNMAPNIKAVSPTSTGEDTVQGSTAECSLAGRSSRRNEDTVRSSFSGDGDIMRTRHFNSLIELLYNLMACGFQGLKGLGEKLYSNAEALVLPGRSYKRKFEEVTQRLDGLESEVKRLKLELQTKVVDCCQQHQNGQSQPIPGSIVLAPPPPPPPQPPPLVPPPPAFTGVKKKQKMSAEPKATTARAIVTLDDLLSVKLRSTRVSSKSLSIESDSSSDDKPGVKARAPLQQLPINQSTTKKNPVVSLKDIQNVSLRKLHVDVEAANKFNARSPENNVLITRRNLRRVNIDRSPGGTPMVAERQESTGTGLTPMMTRALKRKFQFANPSSSSPTSPYSTERRKSLSPLVSPPWSPLSMR